MLEVAAERQLGKAFFKLKHAPVAQVEGLGFRVEGPVGM